MQSAFTVSDRIAMLASRHIVQVGTVAEMRASTLKEVRAFLDARQGRGPAGLTHGDSRDSHPA